MTLERFHEPHPRPALMAALGRSNDRFVLPRIARVAEILVPDEDAARLRAARTSPFVLCPNHPEFFTDWMLDKWLTSRFAARAACWADPLVVNGMGRALRWFWLSNGLVAAVRGAELERALAYSAQALARGDGVLIHPEGEVNWDNEALGTLRAGAVRVAEAGAALAGGAAQLVPLAWFIRFRADATTGLAAELTYVERRLRVAASLPADPAQRLGRLYEHLLEQQAQRFGIELGLRDAGFARRFDDGLVLALERLSQAWPEYRPTELAGEPEAAARAWRSASHRLSDPPADFRRQIGALDKLLRLVPAGVGKPTVTQEQVGERLKRLRLDWLRGTARDALTRFAPRAAAPRDVVICVGEPLAVGPQADHERLLATLRERILSALGRARQHALDRLGPPVRYANPFLA